MSSALIGHTGFVGSTLARAEEYDRCFNSKNIEAISGRHFGRIVCAGVQAVKWKANKDPITDWNNIERLLSALAKVKADVFTLISTVDVYRKPFGVTESDAPDLEGSEPYGRHRLAVEHWVRENFPRVHILRLPGLFGIGLKKNVIFDMSYGNNVDQINPESSFQWYPLDRLHEDLTLLESTDIQVLNMAVEPIETRAIRDVFFPHVSIGERAAPKAAYDMRSVHAALFGGLGDYQIEAPEVMRRLSAFLERPPS